MRQFYDTWTTPVGDFSVALDANGAVIATAFGGVVELRPRFAADELEQAPERTASVRREITEYFFGARQQFTLKLSPSGTPFQQSIWTALQQIPFGETRTYGGLATSDRQSQRIARGGSRECHEPNLSDRSLSSGDRRRRCADRFCVRRGDQTALARARKSGPASKCGQPAGWDLNLIRKRASAAPFFARTPIPSG